MQHSSVLAVVIWFTCGVLSRVAGIRYWLVHRYTGLLELTCSQDHHRWWSRLHEREMGNNESSATDDNREYRALAQSTGGDQLLEAS